MKDLGTAAQAKQTQPPPDFTLTKAYLGHCFDNGFVVHWETVNGGAGKATFFLQGGPVDNPEGDATLYVDHSCMGRDFMQAVMMKLAESANYSTNFPPGLPHQW